MENSNKASSDIIAVPVSLYAESASSYRVLVDHSEDLTCFSRAIWVPKSICKIEEIPNDPFHRTLSAPRWLLDKNQVKYGDK